MPRRHAQNGAALVVALLVFAMCTALIVAMKSEFNLFYQRGANLFLAEQSYAYLRGAEELASLALVMDYDQDEEEGLPRDDLKEVWAQPSPPYNLDEGGWMMGRLEDLQGRFNLNHLRDRVPGPDGGEPPAHPFTPAQEQFIRLLQILPDVPLSELEAVEITESIGDWLDEDAEVRPVGAEDDFYYGRTPAHRAANQPMSSVTELLAVANMRPEVYCALRPQVTVWPREPAPLNIHTAGAPLLSTINSRGDLAPLSPGESETLLALREDPEFNLGVLLAQPVFEGRALEMDSLLTERSDWFRLSAQVEVADRTMHLYSVLQRNRRRIEAVSRHGAVAEPICARLARKTAETEEDGDGSN